MPRSFIIFLVTSFVFFALPTIVFADDKFDIAVNTVYEVAESGLTEISETITITNKTEFIYTPSYTIISGIKDIKNLKTFNDQGPIENELKDTEDGKMIEIIFPTKTVGLGQTNTFIVSFETGDVAKKRGSIWEISIPGLADPSDFSSYNIKLVVPEKFGSPSITKPLKTISSTPYLFDKDEIGKSGVLIVFGDSQVYLLDLTYTITNPKLVPVKTELALPPPTSYQDVRVNDLRPRPFDVYQDADGNWLAVYDLLPSQTRIVKAKIAARVYNKPTFEIRESGRYLSSSKYWEVEDAQIKNLATRLKTPKSIYDYVVNTLSYNFDKVSKNNIRLGARGALGRPDFAVCLEFTDLFIALARAAGISAREIEGYAYTENPKLRPLSLVRDVLHSWPEYFDKNTKTWIMVDPTWGNTTHGVDYFSSFDFDHIAFVIKGASSTYPIPAGGYKINENSKDVSVMIGQPSNISDLASSSITASFPTNVLSGIPISGTVNIKNTGNMALQNKRLVIKSELMPESSSYYIEMIPPYGEESIPVELKATKFLTNRDYEVTILFDGGSLTHKIEVGLFPSYIWIVMGGVISFGSIIVAVATYKTWSIYLQKRR